MLARLQQFTTLWTLAWAGAWLGYWVDRSPVLAWGGALALALAHVWVLALQFALVWALNRRAATPECPAPTAVQMLRAWAVECAVVLRVFAWWQPWRSQRVPDFLPVDGADPARRGVLLVHGFVCNRGLWTHWLQALRARGHSVVAVNLEPVFGSIDDYVPLIDAAVQRLTQATGQAPLVVAHSMGGLAVRAWLRAVSPRGEGDARVHHVVTLGSPHHGTWLGRFSHVPNGRQMRLDSAWLARLAQDEPPARHPRFTCWYSNGDNIVFPAPTATLGGADNRHLPGVAHVQMALHPAPLEEVLARLAGDLHPARESCKNLPHGNT